MRAGRHWNGIQWEDEIHGKWGFDNGTGTWLDIAIDPVGEVIGDDHFMVSVGYWGVGGTIYPGVAEFDNNTKRWTSYHFQTPGELRCVWTDREGYFVSVGDNGMVYTKDGYSASWVYSKAPTDFNLFRLTGVSKDEIYVSGYQGSPTNEFSYQGWKVYRGAWIKLYDTKDTTGTPFHITSADYPSEMGVYRCSVTDSILIYLIGDQSYLFKSFAQMLNFTRTNLSELGLPLKALGRTGLHVDLFSPKDVWIIGTRYNFYHWNGSDFHKLTLPGIPSDDLQFGSQRRLVMTRTGKLFFPTETTSQVYVVDQGNP